MICKVIISVQNSGKTIPKEKELKSFIGDGSNYVTKYIY